MQEQSNERDEKRGSGIALPEFFFSAIFLLCWTAVQGQSYRPFHYSSILSRQVPAVVGLHPFVSYSRPTVGMLYEQPFGLTEAKAGMAGVGLSCKGIEIAATVSALDVAKVYRSYIFSPRLTRRLVGRWHAQLGVEHEAEYFTGDSRSFARTSLQLVAGWDPRPSFAAFVGCFASAERGVLPYGGLLAELGKFSSLGMVVEQVSVGVYRLAISHGMELCKGFNIRWALQNQPMRLEAGFVIQPLRALQLACSFRTHSTLGSNLQYRGYGFFGNDQ